MSGVVSQSQSHGAVKECVHLTVGVFGGDCQAEAGARGDRLGWLAGHHQLVGQPADVVQAGPIERSHDAVSRIRCHECDVSVGHGPDGPVRERMPKLYARARIKWYRTSIRGIGMWADERIVHAVDIRDP